MELWRLLAHKHWYTLNLIGYELKLCARCSGYTLGLIGYTVLTGIFRQYTGLWSQGSMIFMIIMLSTPMILDWVTQSYGFRDSTNSIRIITGALMGLGVGVFSQLSINLQTKRMIFVLIIIVVLWSGIGIKSSRT